MKRSLSLLLLSSITVAGLIGQAAAQTTAPFRFNSPAPAAAPASAAALPAPVDGAIRKIAASQLDLFFGGEFTSRKLSFFALPDEASSASRLVLTLQTAISVAPERSNMIVRINGTDIGSTSLNAGDPRQIQFEVPAGVIQPGYNAVSIEADQRHRVDCSIDATYELWTKVDPDRSGFIFNAVANSNLSLVDLLPISGTTNGRTNMRVILPQGAQMNEYDRALKVVQALSVVGNFNHPQVEFATTAGTGPGIDIYIGTNGDIATLTGKAPPAAASGEVIAVEPGSTDMRKRLILAGLDAADLDDRTRQFVQMAMSDRPAGTPEGLAALTNMKGRLLTPGQTVTLSELGFATKRFDGRYANSEVNFSMPSDFYPGDYASMNLHMSALYVGGLASDAVLTVKANDKEVANISLSSAREGAIRDQRLPIPFAVLRPGQNTLKIEARVPSRLDTACESVDKASAAVRLAIDENSYLEIPNYARIGRYPDIAVLTSGLTPKRAGEADALTYLLVPNHNKQSINAAATFVAKMAYSSGQVKQLRYTSILPALDTSHLIAFGGYDTLPSELLNRMNLDFVNLRAANGAVASPFEVAALENFGGQSDASTSITSSVVGGAVHLPNAARGFLASPIDRSVAVLDTIRSKVSDEMAKFNITDLSSLMGGESRVSFTPTADTALVVAQAGGDGGGLWTVVAARSSGAIEAETDILTDLNVWNKLGGAVQSFSDTGAMIDQAFSSREHLFQTQPMTFSNLRLVTAGWLANNAEIYVIALLMAAIFLGLGTFMVLLTGRRPHG